ncbi:MAG: trehalase family glycosidase [bacterium]
MKVKSTYLLLITFFICWKAFFTQNVDAQGMFFSKKKYQPHPLSKYYETRDLLPSPIYDENPLYVEMYWKTWELAFKNFHEPNEGAGFVSQFIDAAFNANIFLWDTAIMTMFLNVSDSLTPGISSLDNFYAKQHSTGEICREINRSTGIDFEPWSNVENLPLFSRWGFDEYFNQQRVDVIYKGRGTPVPNPELTLDALNHPIAAWAEMESYKWTGDKNRLELVRLPLIKYYEALKKYIRQGNGLYITDWASMDNSPRTPCLDKGGTAIDISAEMVLFARNLAELSAELNYDEDSRNFNDEADNLAAIINAKMWDDEKRFYFDLTLNEGFCPIKTIAAFWTLLSKTATSERAEMLVEQLKNPNTFGRLHPVPSLAADEDEYYPQGGYWSGAVWITTNTMIIKGLQEYGYNEFAYEIALKHIDAMAVVYKQTDTIWENYAADFIKEGVNTNGAAVVKDMVGFSGVTPILHFIEQIIGLKPNAPKNELVWEINSNMRNGCEKFRFNGHVVHLVAEPIDDTIKITVQSDGEFLLKTIHAGKEKCYCIVKGKNEFLFSD